jgi:hypothetical protein
MLSCIFEYQVVTVVSCLGNLTWQKMKTIAVVLSARPPDLEVDACHLTADTKPLVIYTAVYKFWHLKVILEKHFVYCYWNRTVVHVSAEIVLSVTVPRGRDM